MKALLTMTAVLEALTGVALAIAPSALVWLLLGSSLDTPAGLVIGRVLGAALFSLGVACWLARGDAASQTTASLITAMLLYNSAVAALLAHAGIGLGMSSVGLWPTVIVHTTLAVWCAACLRTRRVSAATHDNQYNQASTEGP